MPKLTSFSFLPIFYLLFLPQICSGSPLQYGNYYSNVPPISAYSQYQHPLYPSYFERPIQRPVSRIGVAQPPSYFEYNQNPQQQQYWPPAMLNAKGQYTGQNSYLDRQFDEENNLNSQQGENGQNQGRQIPVNTNNNSNNNNSNNLISDLTIALLNALTSALFPRQQQNQGNYGQFSYPDQSHLPFLNLIPSAGINLGPSQQYGHGSNLGVYAGIQNSQSGYNYNYNTPNGQSQFMPQPIQPYNRPYGPSNSNVGGSYGGLSQWPFIQPVPNNNNGQQTTQTTQSNYISSTIARPTQNPSEQKETKSNEQRTTGFVRQLSLQDLLEDAKNG